MGFWTCSSSLSPGKGVDSLIELKDTGLSGRSCYLHCGRDWIPEDFGHMSGHPVRIC